MHLPPRDIRSFPADLDAFFQQCFPGRHALFQGAAKDEQDYPTIALIPEHFRDHDPIANSDGALPSSRPAPFPDSLPKADHIGFDEAATALNPFWLALARQSAPS